MRGKQKWAVLVALLALALVASSCAGEDDDAAGGTIVAFIPTTTNTYIAEWGRGAQERAAELGYNLVIIENNFDQAEQDTQVQQQLGAGDDDVVAYAWWPSD